MFGRKLILCILDGFGVAKSESSTDAFAMANAPFLKQVLRSENVVLLNASGDDVGLIHNQIGNSEVGHMTIGSGRVIQQSLTRICRSITHDNLFEMEVMQRLVRYLQSHKNVNCHVIGLLSDGGVHSHIDHILHIIEKLNNLLLDIEHYGKIYVHIITDGRDTPPKSANTYVDRLKQKLSSNIAIASMCGRYYAMDRDSRTDRTTLACNAIALGKTEKYFNEPSSISQLIDEFYSDGITDEFFMPSCNENYKGIQHSDAIMFCNFRADRMRQLSQAICDNVKHCLIFSMVPYFGGNLIEKIIPIFLPEIVDNTLGEVLSISNKKQIRIAETEKYAHVTFFFNCGREQPYENEDRIMIPSPRVATYDLQPAMSAYCVTDAVINAITKYDFICVNFANADMVGHTGVMDAAINACEVLDDCISKIYHKAMQSNITLLITADHGNIEEMFNQSSGQPHTAHTMNQVPFICLSDSTRIIKSLPNGYKAGLRDVAPTVLALMDVEIPQSMTGRSIFTIA